MADTATGGKMLNLALWLAQVLLAAAYGMVGWMKVTQPLDKLAIMMKWIPDFPVWFVRGLGTVEVLGAVGLILPSLLRIQPRLTVVAALCILLHQACAVILHLSKGEANVLGLNAVLIALAAFIFWGRRGKSVILPR